MCSGVLPQHPPTTLTPKSRTNAESSRASSSRSFGVDRLALRAHERKAGVGNDADETARVFAKIADRVAHLRGTRRAVETDDVDVQCVERRTDRADVRAEQHPPFGDERRLRLNRHAAHSTRELEPDAGYRRLEFEQVLHRLQQQQIDAAFHERARLLGVEIAQLLVGDL